MSIATAGLTAGLTAGFVAAPSSAVLPQARQVSAVLVPAADRAIEKATLSAARPEAASQRLRLSAVNERAAVIARKTLLRKAAVTIALTRKGMSYSAGSAGPTRFDCSGFTRWVWRKAGTSIARSSYEQYASLTPVSRAKAKPGDLVFFFGSGAHHVALYIGHNKMIHSANYGTGVVVTSLDDGWYASRLSGFRRVV